MPLGTRNSKSTHPTRTQKRKQEKRGARDSEDETDGAPTNTQGIDEDDDLDQAKGINNEVGLDHPHYPPDEPELPRKQIKRLEI
jgi:hypothetical protein